jgi:hypothetical protein
MDVTVVLYCFALDGEKKVAATCRLVFLGCVHRPIGRWLIGADADGFIWRDRISQN